MPIFRTGLLAAILSLAAMSTVCAPASAQEDLRAKGDRLCNGDARRICRKFLKQGEMVVLSCFQRNKEQLSRNCRKFLVDVGQLSD